MRRLVILEGPDAAGKSTLARHLVEQTGAWAFHCTWTPKLNMGMADYQNNVLDNALQVLREKGPDRMVVIDRHWPSEWVYGGVFRSIDAEHRQWMSKYDACIKKVGGVYVFCSDDVYTQRDRHARTQDSAHPYEPADYVRLCGRYFDWWNRMMPITPIYRYELRHHGDRLGQWLHDFESDTEARHYFPREVRAIRPEELT